MQVAEQAVVQARIYSEIYTYMVSHGGGGLSMRQDAMNSWRSGFIRCRIPKGPMESHQELARAEKLESSSAETEDVEC